jgi:hypothetical protein
MCGRNRLLDQAVDNAVSIMSREWLLARLSA